MTVRVTTLPSGLRVATDSMETVESVSLGVWVRVGSRNETPTTNGVAHLLEHMAFKGTRSRNARDIAEQMDAVGGHLNAYTSREVTAYHAKVMREDAGLALDILADILQHSVFDADELARERSVILQEIGQSHDIPEDIIYDHFQAAAFPDQAIGRPVLGTPEIIHHLPRQDVIDYMRHHYTGARMVVAASGRIDHDWLVDRVTELFADLPDNPPEPLDKACYVGGDYREKRSLEQVNLVLGFQGVPIGDEEFYSQSVLSALLGGGMSSRLFQEVRENRGLAYSIYTFGSAYADSGLFGISAGTGPTEVTEMIPVLAEEIAAVATAPSEEEVARAKAQLRAAVLMSQESTNARCEQLAQNLLMFGRSIPLEEIQEKIAAVDPDQVQQVMQRLLSQPPSLAVIGPIEAVEPYDKLVERLGTPTPPGDPSRVGALVGAAPHAA